ncbi:hypothetical protein GOP47_0001940 [Adiantum capillus-veneris]|uniref:Uncharacterized protein n=1 Tax=Adiantum capillus-veneris TaxID=13818 RepID=A0A9D4VB25_ADICA|nr:hypothetical protein GOP47_0001940 [Adiantum capillus-veneris]
MPPRRGQGRGYGSFGRGQEYEEERVSNISREEGHLVEGRRQHHQLPVHHQEQQQHYSPGHRGARMGGRGYFHQKDFVEERGDQSWRSNSRGRRSSYEPTYVHSHQDWRSDAGFHHPRTSRMLASEPAASFEYGGRRGEDQGGGGESSSSSCWTAQDQGAGALVHGGRRGQDQPGSGYGTSREGYQGSGYSGRRENYGGGGGTSSGSRRIEDHGGGNGSGYTGRRGEDQGASVYSVKRGVDQGPGDGMRRVNDQGGGLDPGSGTRRVDDQGEGTPCSGARKREDQRGNRGRRGGVSRSSIDHESGYGRRSYAAGGSNTTTDNTYGGRGRRGGRLAAYPVPPQGSGGSQAPPLGELLPGFSRLGMYEEISQGPCTSAIDECLTMRVDKGGMSAICSKEVRSSTIPSSFKLVAPQRPLAGSTGQAIKVRANHFEVTFHPGDNIYQYDVDISPKISSKSVARTLERQLVEDYSSDLNGKLPVYDGSKSMYTHGPLPFEYCEFLVTLSAEDKGTSGRDKKFKVAIRHVSTLNRKNLEDFLKGKPVPTPQEHLQALDVLLRENPALHFIAVSRSFFKSELGSRQLDGGLVALNGFYQSLRPTENGLQLNIDLSTTAFHASIPVIDFLGQQFRNFDPRYRLTDVVRVKVKKSLARLKVQVIHRQTPRRYRISGLSTSPTKDLKFPIEGGEEMRVVDYFKLTYNYVIEFPELPCLQVQANKPSYLPMEVCVICDGQKYGGKLNDRQTTRLRELACVLPKVREAKIRSIMNKNDGPGRGEHVKNFGVQVVSEMTLVNARLLPPPKLRYGDQGKVKEIIPSLGSWNLLNSCVVEGGNVAYWALISFDQSVNDHTAANFVSSLSRRCNELGVQMAEQTVISPVLRRWEDLETPWLEKNLRYVYDLASQAIHNKGHETRLQLLVCVMAEKHPAYGELKRICETQIGIVTQCCLSKHVKQCKSQYLANLALKVNAKADVTHPSPGDDTGPSIAAVVANIDWPSANRYVARVRAQTHREEIIEYLREMVQELWHEFCEKTRSRPDRVIMFRDGVSEGQFDEVLQKEVVAIKEAFEEVGGPDYKPLITWAVVQKRHHTRLFPADDIYKDKNNNILPGTVVDSTITHPREFDFFLCSHAGIQGTSRPTHYHVLWDENNFKSDDLQGLVYNLCYTYARCTRSVSVVPPAYYAHLAAYRARLYLDSLGGSDTSASLRGLRSGTASSGGGGSSRAAAPAVRHLPRVQRNVQEVMYFC